MTEKTHTAPKRGRPLGAKNKPKEEGAVKKQSPNRPRRAAVTPELVEEMLATITDQSNIISSLKHELQDLRKSNQELKLYIEHGIERAMDEQVRNLVIECRNGLANLTHVENRLLAAEQTLYKVVNVVNGEFYVSPNRFVHEEKDSYV